jgi:hypothetical protein
MSLGGHQDAKSQELLGHKSVETTMIYTHVLNKGGRGVTSPLDSTQFNASAGLASGACLVNAPVHCPCRTGYHIMASLLTSFAARS